MAEATRFLILSLGGESYAILISRLLEISVPRDIQKDRNLTEAFEGKFDYRGRLIPVLNIKKVFKISGSPGSVMLVLNSGKGEIGVLVDSVVEIFDSPEEPLPIPKGVINPSLLSYYRGILRRKDGLVLLLNEDGLFL